MYTITQRNELLGQSIQKDIRGTKSQARWSGTVLGFYTLDGTVGAEESSKLVLLLLKSVAKIM